MKLNDIPNLDKTAADAFRLFRKKVQNDLDAQINARYAMWKADMEILNKAYNADVASYQEAFSTHYESVTHTIGAEIAAKLEKL